MTVAGNIVIAIIIMVFYVAIGLAARLIVENCSFESIDLRDYPSFVVCLWPAVIIIGFIQAVVDIVRIIKHFINEIHYH